jgi:hypothetical protein
MNNYEVTYAKGINVVDYLQLQKQVEDLKANNVEKSKELKKTLEELGKTRARLELLEAKQVMNAIGKCPECVLKDDRIKELELMTTPIGCAQCEMKSERIEELEEELKAESEAKFRLMGQIAGMMKEASKGDS